VWTVFTIGRGAAEVDGFPSIDAVDVDADVNIAVDTATVDVDLR